LNLYSVIHLTPEVRNIRNVAATPMKICNSKIPLKSTILLNGPKLYNVPIIAIIDIRKIEFIGPILYLICKN